MNNNELNFKDNLNLETKYLVDRNEKVNKILQDKYIKNNYEKAPSQYLEKETNRKIGWKYKNWYR